MPIFHIDQKVIHIILNESFVIDEILYRPYLISYRISNKNRGNFQSSGIFLEIDFLANMLEKYYE